MKPDPRTQSVVRDTHLGSLEQLHVLGPVLEVRLAKLPVEEDPYLVVVLASGLRERVRKHPYRAVASTAWNKARHHRKYLTQGRA